MGLEREPAGIAARQSAVEVLGRVLKSREFHDDAARLLAKELEPRDARLASAIVLATLRHRGVIGARLETLLAKALPARSGPAQLMLETALAQIWFLGLPPHAVIDAAVALAKRNDHAKHFSGLVNAVLRNAVRQSWSELPPAQTARLNTPGWAWDRWVSSYGSDVSARMAAAHSEEPVLDITAKCEPAAWAERLGGVLLPNGSIRLAANHSPVPELAGFAEGWWWVQDVAASLPARLLGEVSGMRVADLCAAPGGKTLQLAAAGAAVTAVDKSADRMVRLKENLVRARLSAEMVVAGVDDLVGVSPFDAVLLDAPCSATGTVRRHPELLYIKSESQIGKLAGVQKRLLRAASGLVKRGGTLVYCTCSLEPEEGERQIEEFLSSVAGFELQPVCPDEAGIGPHMIMASGYFRTLPHMTFGQATGMDGFFAARLRRVS